jgi:hypothetical protein
MGHNMIGSAISTGLFALALWAAYAVGKTAVELRAELRVPVRATAPQPMPQRRPRRRLSRAA